ncbi:hemin-degrading factor [Bartonella ancashensis]|uniref:Hemin transport protein HmuS n=1 Tax=Bartonella ancashensis TaxID=1318743 RepID=A0A0M4L8Y4_9HYPH|nr:hemin-degrading factor [Bartonella ancashensis]ALE04013.1 Hemin transport protein HmuS [Bartonella ancashensis]
MAYTAEEIICLREEKRDMRNRDFAASIGMSEAEFVAAYCTIGQAKRLRPDVVAFLEHMPKVGMVMVLTRNDVAVHEVTGCFEKIVQGEHVLLTLGEVDLRIFPERWEFCFEYEMVIAGKLTKSLQFFDKHGTAIFKVYCKDATNIEEWDFLVEKLLHTDQSFNLSILPVPQAVLESPTVLDVEDFRNRWRRMTDVHQLHMIISEFKISRHDAVKYAGSEFASELEVESIEIMLCEAAQKGLPIMCFVGNKGCIQIFTGKVENIKKMGPWLNILDPTFSMHLYTSEIDKAWRVRKPTKDGYVNSLEVFDKNGEIIIQFFGLRKEGQQEREDWRLLLNNLPLYQETATV